LRLGQPQGLQLHATLMMMKRGCDHAGLLIYGR
jgi:hypothetical protein